MSRPPLRILVTGSRTWDDEGLLRAHMMSVLRSLVVLVQWPVGLAVEATVAHGACPRDKEGRGTDMMANDWALDLGLGVEPHPADWGRHGKAAGAIRNSEMVDLGAHAGVAFFQTPGSSGTFDCYSKMLKAGMPARQVHPSSVIRYTPWLLPNVGVARPLSLTRGSKGS